MQVTRTNSKYELIDKLLGKAREGKELKIAYLKMIITPENLEK